MMTKQAAGKGGGDMSHNKFYAAFFSQNTEGMEAVMNQTDEQRIATVVAAFEENPEDFAAFAELLQSHRLETARELANLSRSNNMYRINQFKRALSSEGDTQQDFAKVAGAYGEVLAGFAKKTETLDNIRRANKGTLTIYNFLHTAAIAANLPDIADDIQKVVDQLKENDDGLKAMQDSNHDLITKAGSLAVEKSTQIITARRAPRGGI